jgi:hypothetical protein
VLVVAAVVLLGLVVSACGPLGTRRVAPESGAAARRATRDLAQAESTDLGCKNVVMSEDKRTTAPPEYLEFLTDAVAFQEPCWDHLVFSFAAVVGQAPPGYEVEYRKPPFVEGPNNSPVSTQGEAFLYVTFSPASQTDARDPSRPNQVYKGNLLLAMDAMHHVTMVRKLIDGDGTVMWLIGLDQKRPFTVDAVSDPPRVNLYIDK